MGNALSVVRHRKDAQKKTVDKSLGYALPFKVGYGYTVIMNSEPLAVNGTVELFIRQAQNGVLPDWDLEQTVEILDKNNKVVETKAVKDCGLRCVAQWDQINASTGEVEAQNQTIGYAYFLKEKSGEKEYAIAEMRIALEELPLPTYDATRNSMKLVFKVFMPKTKKNGANAGDDVPDDSAEKIEF